MARHPSDSDADDLASALDAMASGDSVLDEEEAFAQDDPEPPAAEVDEPAAPPVDPGLAPPPRPQVRPGVARRGPKPARKSVARPAARKPDLDFQRTIIPVCLTLAVLLPAFGLYWLLNGEGTPVRLLPWWLPAGLAGVGAVMGLLGFLTMARVRAAMRVES